MSPRFSTLALGVLAVGATAAGLVVPRLSEQQLQAAFCAAGVTVLFAALAAPFVRSDRP